MALDILDKFEAVGGRHSAESDSALSVTLALSRASTGPAEWTGL